MKDIAYPLIAFTGPSGAGKSTLARHALSIIPKMFPGTSSTFSVSDTTRQTVRPGEIAGRDYNFIPVADFEEKINLGAYVEWEQYRTEDYYGTPRSEIENAQRSQSILIFDVDTKGAHSLKKELGENLLTIFVAPPSFEELERRLRARNTESEEEIQKRLQIAREELLKQNDFDILIVNGDLSQALYECQNRVESFIRSRIQK